MEFRLLGPVEIRGEDGPLPLPGGMQRTLLALLLLHANRPLSADRLIDRLWGEDAPPTAAASLQNQIARLRRVIGPERVETTPQGYVLRVEDDELDVRRFERLLEEARGAGLEQRVDLLREALALWRGPALEDVEDEPSARQEATRLDELRLVALEERIDAELALGRHGAVIPELDALVAAHPLRERSRAQLVLALYRAGRQAEALDQYRDLRRVLMDELGLEPSPELRRLEQAILAHDDSLALATAAPTAAPEPPSRASRRLPVVAAIVLAAALAAFVLLRDSGGIDVAANSVALLDPASGEVLASIAVGALPGPIAAGEGSIWVGNVGDDTVSRIDPRAREVVETIELGFTPAAIAAGEGGVWVADALAGTVTPIDAKSNRPRTPLFLGAGGPGAMALATGWGSVWVGNENDFTLSRLVAEDGAAIALIRDAPGKSIAVSRTDVWMLDAQGRQLWQVDPVTNALVAQIPIGGEAWAVAADERSVWITDLRDDAVYWIDAVAGSIRKTIRVGGDPRGIALAGGSVWVANSLDGTVSRIDDRTGAVETIPVAGKLAGVAVDAAGVWVSVG